MADHVAKLLAAASQASGAATDMIEAARDGARDEVSNAWTGETLLLLADAARLLIEANEIPEQDGQLYGALVKWIEGDATDG